MITEERKNELVCAMDYALNKYIANNSVQSNLSHSIADNDAELEFLKGLEAMVDVFEVLS